PNSHHHITPRKYVRQALKSRLKSFCSYQTRPQIHSFGLWAPRPMRRGHIAPKGSNKVKSFPRKHWVDEAFLRRNRPPSVRPIAEMSFRHAVAVLESYPVGEFRDARRRRQ